MIRYNWTDLSIAYARLILVHYHSLSCVRHHKGLPIDGNFMGDLFVSFLRKKSGRKKKERTKKKKKTEKEHLSKTRKIRPKEGSQIEKWS